jgi:hypothetical protein
MAVIHRRLKQRKVVERARMAKLWRSPTGRQAKPNNPVPYPVNEIAFGAIVSGRQRFPVGVRPDGASRWARDSRETKLLLGSS